MSKPKRPKKCPCDEGDTFIVAAFVGDKEAYLLMECERCGRQFILVGTAHLEVE